VTWRGRTDGGLNDADRLLLAEAYAGAASVFEFGLGESTFIAAQVGVERFSGVDSDVAYIESVRARVPPRFRLALADIGATGEWGMPTVPELAKNVFSYQVATLAAEPEAFDVYMIDGRYRVACALLALLHASSRGARPGQVRLVVHDYRRSEYWALEDVAHVVELSYDPSDPWVGGYGQGLAVLERRPDCTDQAILQAWYQHRWAVQ